jgi:hypothetical protein
MPRGICRFSEQDAIVRILGNTTTTTTTTAAAAAAAAAAATTAADRSGRAV